MYSEIVKYFNGWGTSFSKGVGIISNSEEAFLHFLPYIIKNNHGISSTIKVVSEFDMDILNSQGKSLGIKVGDSFTPSILESHSLNRVERVWERGEYSVIGDVVILWASSEEAPIRISLFDNIVEELAYIDIDTRQKSRVVEEVSFHNDSRIIYSIEPFESTDLILYYIKGLSRGSVGDVNGVNVYSLGVRNIPNLDYRDMETVWGKTLSIYRKQGYSIIYSGSLSDVSRSIQPLFTEVVEYTTDVKSRGFIVQGNKVLYITEADLLGQVDLTDYEEGREVTGDDIFKKFIIGDYIVHEDHGIGIFKGIVENGGSQYIEISYAGKDRLLIPLKQCSKISKYIGAGMRTPTLTGLNSGIWKRMKKGVEVDVMEIAKELVQLYAVRSLTKISPIVDEYSKEVEYWDFVKSFTHEDTEDQYVISNQILEDFKKDRPMDRLIVGDVGFGKTELALRSAFAVLNAGKQVAILSPTTILSHQHFNNVVKRFEMYPFRVAELSRIVDTKQKLETLAQLENGTVDIVIGTHSLLQDRVKFKNLGLIIVDEEQRFGVKQKEVLKRKRSDTNVLSLTATPIPRTLSLAINGVREMSILASVPNNRKPIVNSFGEFDWEKVVDAITKEIIRGGQVYYLHNKIKDLEDIKYKLESLVSGIKVALVYGQMSGKTLNKLMGDFIDKKYDVLLSTTIIENGLDLPNVNTLIVDDSHRYGLSQLYQIRGRIGRADVQAYAHFMYHVLKGKSELRLDALKESDSLGAGFLLSNRDLEIRGAGNILGKEQSGVINTVGYGLYSKMLKEAVESLR